MDESSKNRATIDLYQPRDPDDTVVETIMPNSPVSLCPIPGFCIKSNTLQPAFLPPWHSITPPPAPNSLEPDHGPIHIPKGLKVFINIAWDPHVPPPPEGSEDAIQRAMLGQEIDELNPDGWYVPVVVSEGRQDTDKAGKLSLVFDCIYHTSVKSRALRDPEFKIFIVELALQRLEAQTSLVLSRQIGTPNIASKGKLLPRTVLIPSLVNNAPSTSTPAPNRPLIQEITPTAVTPVTTTQPQAAPVAGPKPKGILKNASTPMPESAPASSSPTSNAGPTPRKLAWSWSKDKERLAISISVPQLTRSLVLQTTLDIEPRRLIFNVPGQPTLDINLALSDAEIISNTTTSVTSAHLHGDTNDMTAEPANILTLKRQRDLDVHGAVAEWRVAEGILLVIA